MAPNPKATRDDPRLLFGDRVFNGYGTVLGSVGGNSVASSRVKGMPALWSIFDGVSMV